MSKAIKFKNNMYLDTRGAVHNGTILKTYLDNEKTRVDGKQDKLYDSGWKNITFPNKQYYDDYGGSDFNYCRARRIGNVVYLKGLVNVKSPRNNVDEVVCQLPSGFAPRKRWYVPAAGSTAEYNNGGHDTILTIRPDGTIHTHNSYGTGWISLDCIIYFIDE